jgi:hypothetical protein
VHTQHEPKPNKKLDALKITPVIEKEQRSVASVAASGSPGYLLANRRPVPDFFPVVSPSGYTYSPSSERRDRK